MSGPSTSTPLPPSSTTIPLPLHPTTNGPTSPQFHLTGCSRRDKQRNVERWKDVLEHGGRFKLLEYAALPNPLRLPSASALLDILDCMSFVRSALHGAARTAFNADVRTLVEERFGRAPFDLRLETKLYLLEKEGAAGEEGAADKGGAVGATPPGGHRPIIKPAREQHSRVFGA